MKYDLIVNMIHARHGSGDLLYEKGIYDKVVNFVAFCKYYMKIDHI